MRCAEWRPVGISPPKGRLLSVRPQWIEGQCLRDCFLCEKLAWMDVVIMIGTDTLSIWACSSRASGALLRHFPGSPLESFGLFSYCCLGPPPTNHSIVKHQCPCFRHEQSQNGMPRLFRTCARTALGGFIKPIGVNSGTTMVSSIRSVHFTLFYMLEMTMHSRMDLFPAVSQNLYLVFSPALLCPCTRLSFGKPRAQRL